MTFAEVEIRLIPSPLWGVSLAALCTGKAWDGVRKAAEAAGECRCRFADDPGLHRPGPLHGHERWRYDGSRATLEAIWSVCGSCHDLLHPGRVLASGGEAALDRLIDLYARRSRTLRPAAERCYQHAFAAHARASAVPVWTIDIGLVAAHMPLRLKKGADRKVNLHRWIGDPFGRAPDAAGPKSAPEAR